MEVRNIWKFAAACCLVSAIPQGGWAAQSAVTAKVKEILLDETFYGGCIAQLVSPNQLANCQANPTYVSFDCKGVTGRSKSEAATMLSTAQMAYVTEDPLFVIFDDSHIINGVCIASRVSVIKP